MDRFTRKPKKPKKRMEVTIDTEVIQLLNWYIKERNLTRNEAVNKALRTMLKPYSVIWEDESG